MREMSPLTLTSTRSMAQWKTPLPLPGPGTSSGFGGRREDTEAFYAYSSFNYPSTIFRYDIAAGKSTIFREVRDQGLQG